MRDPRLAKLADVLVNYSVGVRPGQLVGINGPPAAAPLVLEVYRAALAAGGHPVIRMAPEQAQELLLRHGSEAQLAFVNPLALFEVERLDCSIGIWGEENTRALTRADPARVARAESARKPILDLFLRRAAAGQLRWVGTQFPTQACAQDAEMSLAEYEDFVFAAGLLDDADPAARWRAVSQRQQRLTDFLNARSAAPGGGDYRVTAPNGTDVRMSVAGRTWINCDGHENFPDGEVFTGPVLESVQGTIAFSFPAVHHGREVTGVRLRFRDGQVVDATAEKGEEFLHRMLGMDDGARRLGECAIGTNFSIRQYTRNTLFDEKIGGTVHFALGAGYPETGNTNESGLHWDMVVDLRAGGRVEIDGQPVLVDGRFAQPDWPSL